ncbi:hypothetical protein BDN72DRAFT_836131 [Pluteus cervinus]|uniref:Uncharacterized protein n=1 Tax=Pluteus cervinus TaxID=181527 RepID=A0ACD3B3A1_9AGAR|nr:hypothetical protein BDN72DRAFT_836131 [Pluteus cervinus]
MSFAALWSRRLLARVLSTVLCAVLVVLHPFSKYGGSSAFLALALKELVFSVQDNLAQQLEATILHLAGGLAAIGISFLAKYLATVAGTTTVDARSILAIFLMSISFLAGWLKSRLPRLTLSMRIACFISIWLLTTDTDQREPFAKQAKPYLWIILTPAITSLFASLVVLRWSSPQFACDLAAAFSELHSCLVHNLSDTFFQKDLEAGPSLKDSSIREELMGRTISLSTIYRQTAFDLRIGRINMKLIKPLIGIAEHLRRELSWGMSIPRHDFEGTALEATAVQTFHDPAFELGHAILDSMRAVEKVVLGCFVHTIFPRSVESEKAALFAAKRRLAAALSTVRLELKKFCDEWDTAADSPVDVPRNIFDLCLFMISLLQMARELQYALEICIDAIAAFEQSSLRLWYPRLTLAWLGMTPSTITLDERGSFLDEITPEMRTALTKEEALQAVAERGYTTLRCENTKLALEGRVLSLAWLCSLAYYAWNCPRVLRGRLEISRTLKATQHSPHLHHAFKNAAGVAFLSIPAFLPVNSPAQRWFAEYFGQWMLISYVWVLETNSGATWRVAYLRLSGTILGACYACIVSYLFQTNPYGLVSAIALAEIPISWVVINTKVPSLGVVTSVSMPPILFTPYFAEGPHPSPMVLASLRGGMIALGLVAALLMNSILYPRHCRVLFLDSTYHTIGYLSQLYMSLSRDLFHPHQNSSMIEKQRILKLEYAVRKALHRMSMLLSTMGDEISLVPKPIQRYHDIIIILSRLLDTFIGLRKVRENIPRKETVDAVAPQRREMISTVCISLFAAEQVFRGRQPLPQFLPSLHGALETLKRDIQDRIHQARVEEAGSLGLPLLYALAEIDAMTDMVDTVEQLLTVGRQLFGTSTWLQQTSLDLTITMSLHEDTGGRLRGL